MSETGYSLKEIADFLDAELFGDPSLKIIGICSLNNPIQYHITFLSEQFLINGSIEKKDVHSSITKFMISENKTKSNKIDYIIKTPKKSVIPRSEKQKNYVRALRESDIIISCGPAGTGKTFLAVAVALTMILD